MVVSWSEIVLSSSDAVVPVPKSLSSSLSSIEGARAQWLMFLSTSPWSNHCSRRRLGEYCARHSSPPAQQSDLRFVLPVVVECCCGHLLTITASRNVRGTLPRSHDGWVEAGVSRPHYGPVNDALLAKWLDFSAVVCHFSLKCCMHGISSRCIGRRKSHVEGRAAY